MIPQAGIVSIESQLTQLPKAVPITGAASWSMRAASQDHVFFMPYMLPMLLPHSPIEPLTECVRATCFPTEHKFMHLPHNLFDMGQRGRELGLAGNVLHLFPKHEWHEIANFIKSMVLFDPDTHQSFAIGIQELKYDDGTLSSSPASRFTIYALAIGLPTSVYGWQAFGHPTVFHPNLFDRVHAASASTLVNAFLAGDTNPLITTEKIHGPRSLTEDEPSELDHKAALGDEDATTE